MSDQVDLPGIFALPPIVAICVGLRGDVDAHVLVRTLSLACYLRQWRCRVLGFPVIAAVLVLIMPEVAAEEWPKRFVWAQGSDHAYVVLYEDGVAAYSERKRRRGHSDWYFVASHARWAWCDESAAVRRQCLHLYVEGFSDQDQVSFRFDYWYEPSRITEFDKGGSQRVLRGVTLPRRVALAESAAERAFNGLRAKISGLAGRTRCSASAGLEIGAIRRLRV